MRSVAEPEHLLRLEHVTKTYSLGRPNALEVLHGIDMALDRGEFVALVGPSGSGKSTLLNIIGLLDRPTTGRLLIRGADTSAMNDAALTALRNESIGFVFQQSYLLSAFSAIENVMMPMLLKHQFPTEAMHTRAGELLADMGLSAWVDHPASNLSGGQQQRVAIARALAMSPALILADEPTGNLDTHSADSVFEMLKKANAELGTTFLIVTHNEALAKRCDRTLEVVDGQLTNAVA